MAQKFSDAARATLVSGIAAGDTSITLTSGNAFPVANTGTSAISENADWFKLVLQDASKFEIVYARTHVSGASVISDLLRGQEGTPASAFAATSVVGLRQTSLDAVQYAATKVSLESHVGSGGAAHADATGSVDGFMSAADKTKLDGVAAGATNYAHPANHPASIITQDASNRFVTDAEKTTWNSKQAAGNYATGGGTATGTNTGDQILPTLASLGAQAAGTYANGTGSASGVNTGDETLATIKTKLGITTLSGSNTGDQVLPTTLPASDVYAWAKATTKPSYTATEVGLGNVPNLAFSGSNTGDETTATIKTKLGITTLSGSNTGDQTIPTTLPNTNAVTFNTTGGAPTGSTYTGAAVLTVDYATVGAAAAGHTHSYQAADADLLAIGGLVGNSGYLKKTAADTWTLDTSTFATGSGTATGTNTGDQTTITGNAGSATALSAGADRTKLDGIAAGATNYAHPANHPASIITQDASNRFVSDTEKATWNAKQPAGTYATGGGTATGTNTGDQVIPVASSTAPAALGVAAIGVGTTFARADHVHLLPTLATLGAQAAGTYASGTGSASGTNTGDETTATIKTKLGITTLTGTNTGDQVIPTTLPASDVYAWAKAATKPAYTATEVGLGNVPNLAFSGSNTGDETTVTIKTKLGITTLSGANTGDQTIPTTLPASDVYSWAKAATKPSYTPADIGSPSGSGSSTGTNTGDETGSTLRTKLGVTTLSGSNTGDQTIPTTLPASDVYSWAKAATKPSYTAAEVGAQVAGTYATGTGSASGVNTGDQVLPTLSSLGGQAALVSGTNIKTVNGATLLGSGDIVIATGVGGATPPEVKTPTNATPANAATGVMNTATLTGSTYGSLYGFAMAASQWQVSTVSNFASNVISTGDVVGTATSYTMTTGALSVSMVYYWRCRYKDSNGVYSDWSAATSFSTVAAFNSYITTPTATPAAFGDSFEGGFYTGMIWNELVQSASSYAIGTDSKAFVVADMTSTPLVYVGQTLEVRSRANPANKMSGVVTGASGTTLTINVTSVGGSGIFTDWSIMAQYRVIVAPKATGENASIMYKNAQTAAPAACGTLSEGRKATLAMVAAGTSTVYPAAHWCNNLSIAGKTDWYLPARDELELCWRNLKPTADANYISSTRPTAATPNYQNLGSYSDPYNTHGLSPNTSPAGAAYISGTPAQVAAGKNFRTGEAEAFIYGSSYYWSSTEYNDQLAWCQNWNPSNSGNQNGILKTYTVCVRAVRRSII